MRSGSHRAHQSCSGRGAFKSERLYGVSGMFRRMRIVGFCLGRTSFESAKFGNEER